jgi:hypothetical protein
MGASPTGDLDRSKRLKGRILLDHDGAPGKSFRFLQVVIRAFQQAHLFIFPVINRLGPRQTSYLDPI